MLTSSVPLITIEVTPDIALKIRGMAEAGVFAIQTGNASINFHEGSIKSIKTEIMSYPSATSTASRVVLDVSSVPSD